MRFLKQHAIDYISLLSFKCRLLLSICDQSLIEEAFQFLEHQKLSLPTSRSLDLDVISGRTEAPKLVLDEGIDVPNSPLRTVVELFRKRAADANKDLLANEDLTPDSGLGIEDVVKSFLDSPSSNYYRPTEE